MSELRYNLVSKDWVIIASARAKRPHDFKIQKPAEAIPQFKKDCPFCPGNEGDLSDERFRLGDSKAWRTRVVYNKYPALSDKVEEKRGSGGSYKWISGFGICEVMVEHPRHDISIPLMKQEEVADILKTYRERYQTIQKIPGIQAITIFKNHGPAAGCSLQHPHSQLVATPIVPPQTRLRVENALEYYDVTGQCLICQMLKEELKTKKRLVLETKHFVSFIPYAAAAPFITWIIPRRHGGSFDDIADNELIDLAGNLKATIGKLYYGLNNPDYNCTIRSAPVREKWAEPLHWYINVVPRISQPAGFELGTGIFINASVPEDCADFLRKVELK